MIHTCTRHPAGTRSCYCCCGCRCRPCSTTDYRYQKRRRASSQPLTVSSIGTHRRLQALIACGWSVSKLAAQLSRTPRAVQKLLARQHVRASTARRIQRLYDDLWDQSPPMSTGPDRRAMSQALNMAARRGWQKPLCWDDDLIDDPTAKPSGVVVEPAETLTAANLLEAIESGADLASLLHRFGTETAIEKSLRRAGRADAWLRVAPGQRARRAA